jgi:hypothetical protein
LHHSWDFHNIFVSPPYGRDSTRKTSIKDWLRRCEYAYLDHSSEVLALVPVAPNTQHWKNHVWGAARAISFLYDTRLKFKLNGEDDSKGAPMACALVYWGTRYKRFKSIFSDCGAIVSIRHLQRGKKATARDRRKVKGMRRLFR